MKYDIAASIPLALQQADERLHRYGRWAMDRMRVHRCGSAEGRYRSVQNDEDRAPKEILLHIDEAMNCQRAFSKLPERERLILAILYIPRRIPVEMQLRLAQIPPRICQERHLLGLRMFENLFGIEVRK